ncbi:uncharacterized protein MONOS_6075 [Monocercomonoides exilis]|uniref:uncharacterized protein n=1 Tax=Monocercomonoides exilis TaxID=2049356 RepID=UPI00355A3971|nr:hypothetical protein MONOS_6075 [Monocercomonoides exilis]|eukprot:MONOS_6075.1-p1 / transcript=MONOS_6075.1 / gene=MONOS_6075 / organism=Monocercomonoides_exilis_PA203 / gene_product=unspecified product / transcript_product=unspecified product / location=Mono_scaffold00186:51161-52363(+) / protein_length=400 / sequence_SO=supercontig / SO=protein_coding / is_pseudo=false
MDPLERLKKSIDKLSENDLENQQKKQPILFRILDKSFNCYHSIHSWIRAFIFLLTIFIFSTVLVIFIWSLLHRNIYKDSVLSNQPSEMHRLICYMKSTYNWTYELLTRRSRQLKEKEFEFEQLKKNNENLLQQIEQIKKKSEQAEELFKRNLELRKVKRHARPNAGNLISSSMGGKIVKTSTPYDPLAHTPKIPFSVNPRKFVDWLVKGVLKVGSLELEDALIVLSPTEIHEGECFALNGSKGEITAQLSARKAINAISIGHIPKSAHYDQDTAPGEFEAECVCRSQADDEDFNLDGTTIKESCANKNYKKPENSTQFAVNMQTKQNSLEYSQTIVTGTYSAKEGKYQTFHRDDYAETAILCDEMRFVFYSNAGNKNYTCIYRLGAYKLNPNKLNEDSPQ